MVVNGGLITYYVSNGNFQATCLVHHDERCTLSSRGGGGAGSSNEDNLIFGTKDLEFATKKAGLYLYRGSDKKLIRLRDDQICSNGKAIQQTADGGLRLLDIDTPTRQLVAYRLDIKSGSLGAAEVLLDFFESSTEIAHCQFLLISVWF